jgi:hypothetical protein
MRIAICRTAISLVAAGCSRSMSSPGCVETIPVIRVFVRDAQTLEAIAAGSQIVASLGDSADSAQMPSDPKYDSLPLEVAVHQAGVFNVSVRRPGYQEWHDQALIKAGNCGLETVVRTASLTRTF